MTTSDTIIMTLCTI